MGILSAVVFGFLAGLLAKFIMPGHDPGGCIGTSLVGIIGAAIGKYLASVFGATGDIAAWSWPGFGFSVLGAMVFLLVYRMLVARR